MKTNLLLLTMSVFLLSSCGVERQQVSANATEELEIEPPVEQEPGVQMVKIDTPSGEYEVYTKRVGDNPEMKVLLLHGGPGGTHEFFESFEDYFPQAGIEFIYYDQLGSYHSDQPSDTSLWTIERFVDEVEQVRQALGLDTSNFYLFGQSWGGILAAEYALKHQDKMKGLIISNMVMSIPDYTKYAHEVLGPAMPDSVFEKIMEMEEAEDFDNPMYMDLLMKHHYTEHILRMPQNEWPDAVNRAFEHLNPDVYVYMQGHSEFGITQGATLEGWNIKARMGELYVPTLSIGATHDSMDPVEMMWIAGAVQNGRFHLCKDGSHLSQYDDPKRFFLGLIKFIKDVDAGEF
ncbi:MAG: proline iminopeptidase-family hydrolase [Flavobacteriales bacterium]|nr:proline iminopeptidase-family hydrolase [Flavobacteriales bacterium]NNK80897.1 proline iminopeptidase-family hydrolase [Flavobacteriales bacterium]